MESPSRVMLGSQSEEFGWFPSMSTSSTPIRVDTKEVGHIHVLLPTLEYFAPVSSPAVPGLTPTTLNFGLEAILGAHMSLTCGIAPSYVGFMLW